MRWMEQCAYISASRLRGTNLLTASMDAITIARSTNVGDILYITAQVNSNCCLVVLSTETLQQATPVHGACELL